MKTNRLLIILNKYFLLMFFATVLFISAFFDFSILADTADNQYDFKFESISERLDEIEKMVLEKEVLSESEKNEILEEVHELKSELNIETNETSDKKEDREQNAKNEKLVYDDIEIGDIIKFGKYEQDNIIDNGKEEIEWTVIDKGNDCILVLSKYILDSIRYHYRWEIVDWENCGLRNWLNNDFYNESFTKEEQDMIIEVELPNLGNPRLSVPASNNTKDKVFLFSIEEAQHYIPNNTKSIAYGTQYALSRNLWVSPYTGTVGSSVWWIRSPGKNAAYASLIFAGGALGIFGDNVGQDGNGVRPTMWIKLK